MSITLKYWDGRGLMEVPRMLLAIAGKFPGEAYTDGRYNAPADGLDANLGRMPVAQIGDQSIGQSAAINYYFAAENGLLGSNNLEAAQIISIYEHLKELNTAYRAIVPYGTEPTEEMNNKWFDTGATDVSGPAVGADRSSRFLKWWMGRIESTLGNNGFAVGNKLSLADVLLYNTFAEHLRPEECKEDTPNWRKHPMGNSERVAAALAAHPKIKASCDAVAAHPNVQKWLSIRGVQGF